ncbi:MAG: hypothetical protein KIT14_00865 [bacterium]|nr:hypothetical protein [bacterium]
MAAKYITTAIELNSGEQIKVYASPRISAALKEIMDDMPLFHGVKLLQVLEAVYEQGKKDGAAGAFDAIEIGVSAARAEVPHRNPGRPRKKKK